jgi:hypothetical protein
MANPVCGPLIIYPGQSEWQPPTIAQLSYLWTGKKVAQFEKRKKKKKKKKGGLGSRVA